MLIERNEGTKMVAVWLDRAEQGRNTEEASLQKKCEKWKKEGYLPVIYRSGEEDLFENTLALLRHNRGLERQKSRTGAARHNARRTWRLRLDAVLP